jgi:hypothetical protein
MIPFLLAFHIRNKTVAPDEFPERINMSQVRAEIHRRRQEQSERMARARQEQDSSSTSTFPMSQPPASQPLGRQITFYAPNHVRAKGGDSILLNVEPLMTGNVFCRFNFEIVAGLLTSDFSLICRVPPISAGDAKLSVSEDTVNWSSPVRLTVDREQSDVIWLIGAIVFVAGVYIARTVLFRKKRRGKHEEPPVNDEAIDNLDQDKDGQDVRRRAI